MGNGRQPHSAIYVLGECHHNIVVLCGLKYSGTQHDVCVLMRCQAHMSHSVAGRGRDREIARERVDTRTHGTVDGLYGTFYGASAVVRHYTRVRIDMHRFDGFHLKNALHTPMCMVENTLYHIYSNTNLHDGFLPSSSRFRVGVAPTSIPSMCKIPVPSLAAPPHKIQLTLLAQPLTSPRPYYTALCLARTGGTWSLKRSLTRSLALSRTRSAPPPSPPLRPTPFVVTPSSASSSTTTRC
jgi:hypothetical protein